MGLLIAEACRPGGREKKVKKLENFSPHFFFPFSKEREGKKISPFSLGALSKMSTPRNASSSLPSWELQLAKILGVSPEALLAARGGGAAAASPSSPSSPSAGSSAPSPSAPSTPPPLVLYDVTSVTDRQIVNG
jgi:hypothetical protein